MAVLDSADKTHPCSKNGGNIVPTVKPGRSVAVKVWISCSISLNPVRSYLLKGEKARTNLGSDKYPTFKRHCAEDAVQFRLTAFILTVSNRKAHSECSSHLQIWLSCCSESKMKRRMILY